MSASGCNASILVLVILGPGCEPSLPPVLIPWPGIHQLGCETLARPVGKEALGHFLVAGEVWSRSELRYAVIGLSTLTFSWIGSFVQRRTRRAKRGA